MIRQASLFVVSAPWDQLRYYPAARHWTRRVMPCLADPELNAILVRDFNRYTYGTWRRHFRPGDLPHQFENGDWWLDHRGPMPRFWQYVKSGACHALVNFNLKLAQLVEPVRPWRIVTSDKHSTVWDGATTLWDLNFLALGVAPQECLELASSRAAGGRQLPVGKQRYVHSYPHYTLLAEGPPSAGPSPPTV
jgi:hypothetical protein